MPTEDKETKEMPTEDKETKELTYGESLAQLIMAEPKGLCAGRYIDEKGARCVNGAVGDAFDDGFFYWRQAKRLLEFHQRYYNFYQTYAHRDSNDFQGTNKERQRYMAEKVKVLR